MSIRTPYLRGRPETPPASNPPLTNIGGMRLLRRLGAGGMAEVYLAYDAERHKQVAVKVLPDDLARNPTYVHRFQREAEVGKKVAHPNLVRCLEEGQDDQTGQRFLVMEYVKGRSAQARLDWSGPIPLAEAVSIIQDIARALEELHHRGFVHRDVKPGNILIHESGLAKLADLGVAKQLSDGGDLTSFDSGIGTPYYMPWEQSLNASLVDPRSDLFALGATFYHLLTGKVPFPGTDVAEVARKKEVGEFEPARKFVPTLPRSVDTILAKLLARLPAERFQTAAQLIDTLRASGLATAPDKAPPKDETALPPAATRPDPRSRKRRGKAVPIWSYQFRHGSGWKKGKARRTDLVEWYQRGVLPEELFLAPPGTQTCRHFRTFPEFRGLTRLQPPPPTAPPRRKSSPWRGVRRALWGVAVAGLVTVVVASVLHFAFGG